MAQQVQFRRGTTSQHSTFTGAVGEVTVDTDKDVVVVHDGSTAGGFPLIGAGDIGTTIQAYDADTAKTDVVQSFTAAQRGSVVALTAGATVTPDFAAGNNFSLTIDQTTTLANPSNLTAGESGAIAITQDATTAYALSYGSSWKIEGGAPIFGSTLSATSTIVYYVVSGTHIAAKLISEPIS